MNKESRNKIKIGIDGNEANVSNRVGVNTYAYETLKAIAALEHEWKDEISIEVLLRQEPGAHMPSATESFKYKVLPGSGMWIIKRLTPFLMKHKNIYDVFWTPSHYVPLVSYASRVCSVMDLGYLESSSQFKKYDYLQLKLWTTYSLYVSKKIISISDATKNDIAKHYPYVKGKIVTTLLGFDKSKYHQKISSAEINKVKSKFNITDDYILFISTLKPSKNIEGLLKAWHRISQNFPTTKLVIAGKKGWLFDSIFALVEKLNLTSSVIFTDFVEEDLKAPLIAGAKVFILPSYWEGFGLDVLSAMSCGIPVIVSNRGSLPEVVGDAGFIVDPDDTEDIAASMSRVLTMNKKEYQNLVHKGLERSKMFDWAKTARETLNVLKSAI